MKEEDVYEHTNGKYQCLHFSMQEDMKEVCSVNMDV